MPKYNIINMPGPGDRETWGDTSHDPRSPEYDPGPHLECAVCDRNTADYEDMVMCESTNYNVCQTCVQFNDLMTDWVSYCLDGAANPAHPSHSTFLKMSYELEEVAHAHVRKLRFIVNETNRLFISSVTTKL